MTLFDSTGELNEKIIDDRILEGNLDPFPQRASTAAQEQKTKIMKEEFYKELNKNPKIGQNTNIICKLERSY